jgi:hypothetical protein
MNKWCGWLSLILFLLTLLLVVGSWILSAWGYSVRGILQPEGIRWLFVTFPQVWATSATALLVMLLSAVGGIDDSGLWSILRYYCHGASEHPSYRQRLAFKWSIFFQVLFLLPYILLSFTPHSLLLSVSGSLWHGSPFVNSLPYVLILSLLIQSLLYGILCGRVTTLARVMQLLTQGIIRFAPLLVVYLQARLLYVVFRYVVGG